MGRYDYLLNPKFWKYALLRAVRTIAQTAAASIGSTALFTEVNWGVVCSAAGIAGLLSVLMSMATGIPEVNDNE